MNRIWSAVTVALAVAAWLPGTAAAHSVSGSVYCDVNQSRTIDGGDLPLAGVQLFISSEGYSPLVATTDGSGSYNRSLETVFTTWMMQIIPGTVPADAVVIGPAIQSFDITADNLNAIVDWLIDSEICRGGPVCGDGVLDEGEQCDDGNNVDGDGCSAECTVESYCGDGVLDEGEECDDGNFVDGDGCSATCQMEGSGLGSCTPGYWKQPHHFDSWTAPLTPDTLFSDVFENAFPGKTLVQVAAQGGGHLKALGRHTVAALLNAASADVGYPATVADVIATFNSVYPSSNTAYGYVKDVFATLNEDLECPLN